MDIVKVLKTPFRRHPSSGNWLYKTKILGWITEPEFKQQLPFDYQQFAGFCAIKKTSVCPESLVANQCTAS